MRHRIFPFVAVAAVAAGCASNASTAPKISLSGDPSITWGPAPAVFPPGAQLAVLEGDPSKSEEFTVRLRMPSGYKIPPHTHPTDEHVTVVSGQFKGGMGSTFDESAMNERLRI